LWQSAEDNDVHYERMSVEPAVTFIRPQQLTAKATYAYAAVTGPGRLVFTAGACPLDTDGNTVAVADVAGQALQVMANLVTALHAAGTQLTDVVKTTGFVASSRQADLGTAWNVVRGRLRRPRRLQHPARRQRPGLRRPARRGRSHRHPSTGEQLTDIRICRHVSRCREGCLAV
jgi:enamine deaminase RidA (YjgF/YER057c/UK114 family)